MQLAGLIVVVLMCGGCTRAVTEAVLGIPAPANGCNNDLLKKYISQCDVEKIKFEFENKQNCGQDLDVLAMKVLKKSFGGDQARNTACKEMFYVLKEKNRLDINYSEGHSYLFSASVFDPKNHHIRFLLENGAEYSQKDIDWFNDKKCSSSDGFLCKNFVNSRNFVNNFEWEIAEKKKAEIAEKSKIESIAQQAKKEIEHKNKIESLTNNADFESLKKYTEDNPESVCFVKDESLRLALTGPKGLKVGDIRKLLKNGKSEVLVKSLIKSVESPYKNFTLEEIELLSSMGLSDEIISSMIEVTTELLKDAKRKEEQAFILSEQKRIAEQKPQVQSVSENRNSHDNSAMQGLGGELTKQGVKLLLEKLF